MTTLTKAMREQIIDSVINKGTKLKEQKEDLIKRTQKRVRELCIEKVPKDFIEATKNMPAVWFPHTAYASIHKTSNPIALVKHDEEQLRKGWFDTVDFEPFRHPVNMRVDRAHQPREYNETVDNPESWPVKLSDLIEEAKKLRASEDKARDELRAFLLSVRTVRQVLEKMPELEPHLPSVGTSGKPMPLVVAVTPILKTLDALGFDQTQTKKKSKK